MTEPSRAPLSARLNALAEQFAERGWADPEAANSSYLVDHAASLAEFARQCEEEYVRVVGDDEVPTNAQGVALARFLRPAFRSDNPGDRAAHVSRGGQGLPDHYLLVVHADGYTGGIDRDGRVST